MTRRRTNVLVPPRNSKTGQGRFPVPIDLDAVIKLASHHLPHYAIAAKLGMNRSTWDRHRAKYPEIQDAIEQGIALAQSRVAEAINHHMPKNPIVSIFAAKQAPEKGGLGWADKQEHVISGTIEHRFPALDAWRQAMVEQREAVSDQAVDADYEVLE